MRSGSPERATSTAVPAMSFFERSSICVDRSRLLPLNAERCRSGVSWRPTMYSANGMRQLGRFEQVRLSELFTPGKDSLVVYSFMFKPGAEGEPLEVPCPLCSSIIDGVDGAVPHITQRINFAVVTKAPIGAFRRTPRSPRLAARASALIRGYELQRRLQRRSPADDDQYAMVTGVRPPREQDLPLLEQRAVVHAARAWPESAPCRLHLAHCGRYSTGHRRVGEPTGGPRSPTRPEDSSLLRAFPHAGRPARPLR